MKITYSLKHCEEEIGTPIGGADKIPDGEPVLYMTSKHNVAIRVGDDVLYWSTISQEKALDEVKYYVKMGHETFPKGATICFFQD
jgi:hypothetical protein